MLNLYQPPAKATGNATSTVRVSNLPGDPWAAFDRLPPEVRRALQYTVLDICPKQAERQLRPILRLGSMDSDALLELHRARFGERAQPSLVQAAAELFVDSFHAGAEAGEVELLSAEYRTTYGTELPHVAAGASILRESQIRPRSAARRRQTAAGGLRCSRRRGLDTFSHGSQS